MAAKDQPSEDLDCAICFEPSATQTTLPCSCNVTYCNRCWDRALAQSYNACGEARCPTCRGPVCVDFDPDRACLVFSRESTPPVEEPCEGETAITRAMQRRTRAQAKLREQARPVQVRLLQRYGAESAGFRRFLEAPEEGFRQMSVPELKGHISSLGVTPEDDVEKEDLIRVLLVTIQNPTFYAIVFSNMFGAISAAPTCICGCHLQRVSGQERTWRCSEKFAGGHPPGTPMFEAVYRRLTEEGHSVCFCDLCEQNVPSACAVWTCEQGDSTILHATSYDVCDQCFFRCICEGCSVSPPMPSVSSVGS